MGSFFCDTGKPRPLMLQQMAEVRKAGAVVWTSLEGVAWVCIARKLETIRAHPSHPPQGPSKQERKLEIHLYKIQGLLSFFPLFMLNLITFYLCIAVYIPYSVCATL